MQLFISLRKIASHFRHISNNYCKCKDKINNHQIKCPCFINFNVIYLHYE